MYLFQTLKCICLKFCKAFFSNSKRYLLNHATSRVDPCWPVKCGRDLVRRQEILPKLQQEEEEEEEEEEEGEASGALADWLGRPDGSQGPDGRGSTVGLARADQPFSHFPSPGPATPPRPRRDLRRPRRAGKAQRPTRATANWATDNSMSAVPRIGEVRFSGLIFPKQSSG